MSEICVIFDLDGTLVDSEALNCRAFLELLPEITDSAETLASRYRGMKLAEILADMSTRYAVDLGKNFEPVYRQRVAELYDSHLSENPGVTDLLQQLSCQLCVASSAPFEKITHALTVTNLAPFFGKKIFSSYDVGSWKPEPALFLHAASRLGFSPGSCVVVEDSSPGVAAGIAAGMYVCHYRGTEGIEGRCQSFSEMRELGDIIGDYQRATHQRNARFPRSL